MVVCYTYVAGGFRCSRETGPGGTTPTTGTRVAPTSDVLGRGTVPALERTTNSGGMGCGGGP